MGFTCAPLKNSLAPTYHRPNFFCPPCHSVNLPSDFHRYLLRHVGLVSANLQNTSSDYLSLPIPPPCCVVPDTADAPTHRRSLATARLRCRSGCRTPPQLVAVWCCSERRAPLQHVVACYSAIARCSRCGSLLAILPPPSPTAG